MPDVWVPKAELAVADSGDRLAILDLDHPDRPVMILAGTAREIWRGMGEGTFAADIAAAIAEENDVEERTAIAEVTAALAGMANAGMLQERFAAAEPEASFGYE